MNDQIGMQQYRWNIFARMLQDILVSHGYGLGHLDDRAGIHPEKVRRLQRSLKVPKSFPVLNIEEMEYVNAAFHLNWREKVRLRAALLATSIEETLMDRIEPHDALKAAEQIFPIIEQALLVHGDELAGMGAIKGHEPSASDANETDQRLGDALTLIDHATLSLHLSQHADSQIERIERAHQAEVGFTAALTQLLKASTDLKETEAWNVWFFDAQSGLRIARELLISLGGHIAG